MPDHLILIRAGVTDYDLQERIRGTLDMPLCAAGVAEAEHAATLLALASPAALYAADSQCATETARIVGRACGLRPRRAAGLANLDLGLWQGLLVDDIRRKQPRLHRQWQDNPWAVAPPEGELLEDACVRVEQALEKILRRHAVGRIGLVVPHPLDRVVRWIVSGRSMGDLWSMESERDPVSELPVAAQWRTRRGSSDGGRAARFRDAAAT
jgi:broad specificity phosphatase PhoE